MRLQSHFHGADDIQPARVFVPHFFESAQIIAEVVVNVAAVGSVVHVQMVGERYAGKAELDRPVRGALHLHGTVEGKARVSVHIVKDHVYSSQSVQR